MRRTIAGFPLNAMLSPGSRCSHQAPVRSFAGVLRCFRGSGRRGRCGTLRSRRRLGGLPVGLADDVGLAVGFAVGEAVGLGVGDAVELGVFPGLDRTTKDRDVNTSVFLPFWAWPVPLVAVTSKTYRPSGTGAFPLPEATVPSQPMSVMPGLNPYPFKLKTMLSLAMGLPFEPSAFA